MELLSLVLDVDVDNDCALLLRMTKMEAVMAGEYINERVAMGEMNAEVM